jgi:hypothetical protein
MRATNKQVRWPNLEMTCYIPKMPWAKVAFRSSVLPCGLIQSGSESKPCIRAFECALNPTIKACVMLARRRPHGRGSRALLANQAWHGKYSAVWAPNALAPAPCTAQRPCVNDHPVFSPPLPT